MSDDRLNQIRGRLQEADHIFEPEMRADVKWLLDEVERLRKQVEEMRPWYPPTHERTRPVTTWPGQSWAPPEDLIDQGGDDE